MVELYQYLLLNKDEKAKYLWEYGSFIINLVENDTASNLYSLNGYFVEVMLADNIIVEITAFKKGERLNKYLDFIDVSIF